MSSEQPQTSDTDIRVLLCDHTPSQLAAEVLRLRSGVRAYLDGEYPHPRQHHPGRCEHGLNYWETCQGCDRAHFERLLAND